MKNTRPIRFLKRAVEREARGLRRGQRRADVRLEMLKYPGLLEKLIDLATGGLGGACEDRIRTSSTNKQPSHAPESLRLNSANSTRSAGDGSAAQSGGGSGHGNTGQPDAFSAAERARLETYLLLQVG